MQGKFRWELIPALFFFFILGGAIFSGQEVTLVLDRSGAIGAILFSVAFIVLVAWNQSRHNQKWRARNKVSAGESR